MVSTRRLAAILAADVAGYSRLIGLDESATLEHLKALRATLIDPKIAEHRGRIVKTTGDGMLVEFASVVDALRCATEWQRGMAERNGAAEDAGLDWRIGVHQGDVVVEDGDIFGDGVNVAARLEGLADPGGICVSARVQEDAAGRLDLAFDDLGEQNLKNIARSVRVYRVRLAGGESAPKTASPALAPAALPLPDKPSLAVLPFQNMSGDPEQEYFADGMVEEITTAIARLPWLFVIARNSSFTYKGKAVDVKQVARELGVRYVLEGSVRKGGNRVRITSQLIDTASGAHIWADRFDGALDDVFELQDHVASGVVGAIEPKLRLAEIERATRKPTAHLDAYDLYLRALAQFHKWTRAGHDAAIDLARRALAIDPAYAPAAAMVGWCRVQQRAEGWMFLSRSETEELLRLARQAIEAGRDDPDVLWMTGFTIAILAGDYARGVSAIERALTLNPNSFLALVVAGWLHSMQNRPGPAMDALRRAKRLSPLAPLGWMISGGLALANLVAGQYEEAIEFADQTLRDQPDTIPVLLIKAAACGHLGLSSDGADTVRRLRAIFPRLTVARYTSQAAIFLSPEVLARYAEGLGKAGLPAGADI